MIKTDADCKWREITQSITAKSTDDFPFKIYGEFRREPSITATPITLSKPDK
jgi:hypothetical protein